VARRGEELVKIWRAEVVDQAADAAPGTVLDAEALVLATGAGALRLHEVQPQNRSRQEAGAFARGYRVLAGEVWLKPEIA
jgi:methionyl-tRNA formyltransferase